MPYYTDDFMYDVMKIEYVPNNLYHYTSIENLACILKNRKLRFSRLDSVNDKNEAKSIDIRNANTLVFVSCWTNSDLESIPMWNMYANNMCGVRIKMPTNLFKGRRKPIVFERGGARIIIDSDCYKISRDLGMYSLNGKIVIGPNKIHYSNDLKYLETNCLVRENGIVDIDLSDLGMFKDLNWMHEDEWRFRILGVLDSSHPDDENANKALLDLEKYKVTTKFIDLEIDEEVFDEIEITTGPKISEPQKIILDSLINNFAPKAKIVESKLAVR